MQGQSKMIVRTALAFAIFLAPLLGLPSVANACFPALGTSRPDTLPDNNSNWWCNPSDEYAFLGFSYDVTACQDSSQLRKDFKNMREKFNSRYVRLHGACDSKSFYDEVIETAWENNLGVHALIWFGSDGDDRWKSRRDALLATLHSNPRAPFVTRVVQFGSQPLFDSVLDPAALAQQVKAAQANLKPLGIPVTISELAYGYQQGNGVEVLDAIDSINANMLPYLNKNASTGANAWPAVLEDLDWFIAHGKGKKIYLDENGWPSATSPEVQPNSPNAVADVSNEEAYYKLLDSKCEFFRGVDGGGVGWFSHMYSDQKEPGYGIYDSNGMLKFPFQPRTEC